ncbi:MAG: hypothetical protein ACREBQ_12435, partial [Nitrososphaerales archaeon]
AGLDDDRIENDYLLLSLHFLISSVELRPGELRRIPSVILQACWISLRSFSKPGKSIFPLSLPLNVKVRQGT